MGNTYILPVCVQLDVQIGIEVRSYTSCADVESDRLIAAVIP